MSESEQIKQLILQTLSDKTLTVKEFTYIADSFPFSLDNIKKILWELTASGIVGFTPGFQSLYKVNKEKVVTDSPFSTDVSARFRSAIAVVDMVVYNESNDSVLMGTKPLNPLLRFPGGFVDIDDDSYEDAAKRELSEECPGIEVQFIENLGSFKIDDDRYKDDRCRVFTTLFLYDFVYGNLVPGDDLDTLQWVPVSEINLDLIVPAHHVLIRKLKEYWCI